MTERTIDGARAWLAVLGWREVEPGWVGREVGGQWREEQLPDRTKRDYRIRVHHFGEMLRSIHGATDAGYWRQCEAFAYQQAQEVE